MAKQPFFASAPRISLFIDGARVGYAIGLTLNVSVTIEPIKVLGMFETLTLEPLAYLPVSGSMRIIKLLPKSMQDSIKTSASAGNDIFLDKSTLHPGVENTVEKISVTDQSALYSHVIPGAILISTSFNVEIMIKRTVASIQAIIDASAKQRNSVQSAAYTNVSTQTPSAAQVQASSDYQKLIQDKYDPNSLTQFYESTSFMTIKDCRITGMDSEISPARLMEEAVSYQGLLAINTNEAMDYVKDLK